MSHSIPPLARGVAKIVAMVLVTVAGSIPWWLVSTGALSTSEALAATAPVIPAILYLAGSKNVGALLAPAALSGLASGAAALGML